MKKIFLIAFATLSCKESGSNLTDLSQTIRERTVHRYELYKDGKVKADHEIRYLYKSGHLSDSSFSVKFYTYNSKGRVTEINFDHISRRVKLYNDFDSLIADYKILRNGDTTQMSLFVYDKERLISNTFRSLFAKLPEDPHKIKRSDFRNYDTTFVKEDLIYTNGIHTKSIFKDIHGRTTEESKFYEENGKLRKSEMYSFLGTSEFLQSTTYFINDHDSYTINFNNDTIASTKTFYKDKLKMGAFYNENFRDWVIYNKKGQMTGAISEDIISKEKRFTYLKYFESGFLQEETIYKQNLK